MRRNTSFTRLGSRLAPFVVLAGMVLSGGCASQDPVGIRIAVDSGGKGTMTVAALTSPAIASLRPKTSEGVDWAEGVRLTITAGDFDSIDDVSYDDLTVDAADFAALVPNQDVSAGRRGLRTGLSLHRAFIHEHIPCCLFF